MNQAKLRARYRRILYFFFRQIVSFIFWELILSRIGLRRLARRTRTARYRNAAVQFRAMAIQLGGLMIKVGQFLSARLDVLPPEITDELSGLQDEVPPEDVAGIRALAEKELGVPLEKKFARFDPIPLAAASLGQVHRAQLCVEGNNSPEDQPFCDVVVKIQRPYIEQLIEVDLSALRRVGRWLEHYRPIRKRADVRALIEEFASTVYEEIDYLAEGRNAEIFSENFRDQPSVHVPRVVWSATTKRVLTLEDVYAIKITDYDAITAAGIDRAEVARRLIDTYFQQIFEDGFFHADPHPGNLFVTPLPTSSEDGSPAWQLTFVDFGMVGRVPANLKAGLRELIIAIGTRDASRVVRAYQQIGVLLPGADLALIEQAEAQLFDRFWGKSMNELRDMSLEEIHRFAHQFRELIYTMPFQIPHNLLLLGRCVAILSGMATGLDPQFNLWDQLVPYAQQLVQEETTGNWRQWLSEFGEVARALFSVPTQAARVLSIMERGELKVAAPQISRQVARLEAAVNRLAVMLAFAALLLSGVQLLQAGRTTFAIVLLVAALMALFAALFSRSNHSD
jgi:predicted unusual protein kinase regulating ubiquinone biosynthesis (AarF/ABC1/UbiB family)